MQGSFFKINILIITKPLSTGYIINENATWNQLIEQDTSKPMTPTGLTVVSTTTDSVKLSWNASTDDFGVSYYDIYRNGVKVATTVQTTYEDKGLQPGTTYAYFVAAYDRNGNGACTDDVEAVTEDTPIVEDNDTEERADRLSISIDSNNNIIFNEQNVKWDYIGIPVLEFLKTCENVSKGIRTKEGIDNFNKTYKPTLDKITHDRNLNLSAGQIELIFLIDPEGVRDYLYGKSESLINDVFFRLTGKEPIYYEKTLTGWEQTDRRPETVWDNFSEVMSDAHALLVRKDGMPHDLISLVLPTIAVGLTFIALSEIALVAEGIAIFGVRNTVTMYSCGTLASTIAFQKGINGVSNAVNMADEIIEGYADRWLKSGVERGYDFDRARGNNLGSNFPIADRLENRILTSTKSLDTAAATYQNGSKLLSKLKSFVNQLNGFTKKRWNGVYVRATDYDSKVLELIIPDVELSSSQVQAIIDAKAYIQSFENISLKIIVAR